MLDLTRDNVQLLINSIWQLPTERVEESIVAKLPPPKAPLPRARKLPVPKPLTKWEEFAKKKGIKKRTRDKKVFDPVLDKWVPTYGYQRYKAEKEKDWVLEVPQNDPYRDMFKEKRDLRLERVAKNEVARMKNIARAKKIATPRTGFVGPETASAKQVGKGGGGGTFAILLTKSQKKTHTLRFIFPAHHRVQHSESVDGIGGSVPGVAAEREAGARSRRQGADAGREAQEKGIDRCRRKAAQSGDSE